MLKKVQTMLPHLSASLATDHLPELEGLDITGSDIAHRIQGSAGPGGCDSAHWQDALLHYGSASYHL